MSTSGSQRFFVMSPQRLVLTAPVPLRAFPGAGARQGITSPWPRGSRLTLSRPVTPVPADPPGHLSGPAGPGWPRDRSGLWLGNAAAGLCVLAAAAAAVSCSAQYRMVDATRHFPAIAALEAGIPDVAALVFACLGVALALRGRRAVRARALNLVAVSASVFMNAIAAGPGWRDLVIWVLPPAAYALASDTLIGVVRVWVIARHPGAARTPGRGSLPAAAGGVLLWLLRLAVAPVSTLAGLRGWVVRECPVAPGRRATRPAPPPAEAIPGPGTAPPPRKVTKTARFLNLVSERHGPLAQIPLESTARIAAELAPQAALDQGAARTALRKAVLAARQDGDPR